MYHEQPMFVIPNWRQNGFVLKFRNKMGLNWLVQAELYNRQNEIPEARQDQNIDDFIYNLANEFPNIGDFPNINAPEFHMPRERQMPLEYVEIPPQPQQEPAQEQEPPQNQAPVQQLIQEPEINQLLDQEFEQNGRLVDMPAGNIQPNIPIVAPMENLEQNPDIVPIEPMPIAQALPIIDNVLHYNEDDNVNLMMVEEDDFENYPL